MQRTVPETAKYDGKGYYHQPAPWSGDDSSSTWLANFATPRKETALRDPGLKEWHWPDYSHLMGMAIIYRNGGPRRYTLYLDVDQEWSEEGGEEGNH